ncbi:helix-turn-helix domain-containing protein [Sarcina ventriculi]|uniref:helix-turn-helix domain-containing protein n=1 Tax=Sarcina ventriculi TaxID=1267 RepID=UPI001C110F29|nr:helix-turn-helix domain-containing protein [Sarcina ventriculi]MBU5323412.1 helix-turn-helix domain-containing protein [Sarcina ventriculi]
MSKKVVSRKVKEKSSLRFEGIYENGYGLISKSFMKDKRLTIEAKSIYTYLCSYCGGGTTAYPSVALQCSDLCISESRYYKHRQLLLEYGYIKVEQERELVEYEDGTKKEMFSHNVYTIVLNIDKEFLEKKAPKKKAIKSKTSKTKSAKSIDMTNNSENTQNEGTQIVGTQNVGNNNNSFNNNSFNNNNINNISSSKEEAGEKKEEDNTFNNDLKTLMSFCNNVNYKLSKEKAKTILLAFGLDKVIKAITTIISTVDTNNIKNYAGYLTATLKDMETTKNITIENKIESTTNSNNKPSNFANFTQRKYDYDKLEKQLLGWDDSDDDYEV